MDNFDPAARRQNRASGAILGEKAMRATLEWLRVTPSWFEAPRAHLHEGYWNLELP